MTSAPPETSDGHTTLVALLVDATRHIKASSSVML
jgi:hypothetical protein